MSILTNMNVSAINTIDVKVILPLVLDAGIIIAGSEQSKSWTLSWPTLGSIWNQRFMREIFRFYLQKSVLRSAASRLFLQSEELPVVGHQAGSEKGV